jgi:hypothetical protein
MMQQGFLRMDKKKEQSEDETKVAVPSSEPLSRSPAAIAGRVAEQTILGAAARIETLYGAVFLAFAGLFLMIAWQFGPLVLLQAHEYRKMTGHVDARIVESWLALEFDGYGMRVPTNWRAETNAARCVVVEYDGDWGAPLRRAFCGTRIPFNQSYGLADLNDISPDVPFAWARDEHGFVVPEIRLDARTLEWLGSHPHDTFMHPLWPAKTLLDDLRVDLDRPVAAAVNGWAAQPPVMPLTFDPARPAEALPTGILVKRLAQQPNWLVMAMGFVVGGVVWFKTMATMPLLSGLAPWGRWILSLLLLSTLPWWMDTFPAAISHVSRHLGSILADMFADIAPTDRLVATDPAQATLATGERLVWRLGESIYADTIGTFRFVPPDAPLAGDVVFDTLSRSIAEQTRALDDAKRAALFARLERDKRNDLTGAGNAFLLAAKETAIDPAASAMTRAAAERFLRY